MRRVPELPDLGEPPGGARERPSRWTQAREDLAIVLWPSFLVAAAATMFFFATFDPAVITEGTALGPLAESPNAGYAFGFFAFWLATAASSWITVYLARTSRPAPRDHEVEPWMRDKP